MGPLGSRAPRNRIRALTKETPGELSLPLSALGGYKKLTAYDWSSPEPSHAGTPFSDFQAPELGDKGPAVTGTLLQPPRQTKSGVFAGELRVGR